MKKKKLKKIITPIVLLVVLGALVAGFAVLKHKNSIESADSDEAEAIVVLDKSNKTVCSVELTSAGETVAFTYENEVWTYDGDEKFPVDQDDVDSVAQELMLIKAYATVSADDRGEDSEYGLDSPNVTAKASYSDGTAFTFNFGNVNPFNDYQYFTVTGDSAVYMADTSVSTALAKGLDSFFKSETFPLTSDGVTADDVTSITVLKANGEENIITDSDGCDSLLDLVKVLNLVKWEDYYADSDEMAEIYGISENGDRVTVSYTKTVTTSNDDGETINADVGYTVTMLIGSKFDTSDSDTGESGYFYTMDGSTVVYATDSETVEQIFEYLTYEPGDDTAEEE